ncbi:MAG: hypothetical protein SGPRY_002049 [Prymnesium sp.]
MQRSALIGLRMTKRYGKRESTGIVTAYRCSRGFTIEFEDREAENISEEELLRLAPAEPHDLVGRQLKRHFPGHGVFVGTVDSYNTETGADIFGPTKSRSYCRFILRIFDASQGFRIRYEDGDEEDLLPVQLLRCLLPEKAPRRRQRQNLLKVNSSKAGA